MYLLVIGLLLFIFQIATILVIEFRNPNKTVAWLMILFVVPLIGFVMYYFMAKEYTHRRKVRRRTRKIYGDLQDEVIKKLQHRPRHYRNGPLRNLYPSQALRPVKPYSQGPDHEQQRRAGAYQRGKYIRSDSRAMDSAKKIYPYRILYDSG